MYAAIGDDGRRPVVWGLGATEEVALEEAREKLHESDCTSELRAVEVSEERAARIASGDVDASDL